jgi:hypothetical protein
MIARENHKTLTSTRDGGKRFKGWLAAHRRVLQIQAMGSVRSFCFHRLLLLEQKFNLHVMMNADKEFLAQKSAPHRDFYNVRKVTPLLTKTMSCRSNIWLQTGCQPQKHRSLFHLAFLMRIRSNDRHTSSC